MDRNYLGVSNTEAAEEVRLVRACGSKRLIISVPHVRLKVRLVRACGSKLVACIKVPLTIGGQARKSLWIETVKFV